jgi:hypothetical protein
VACRFPANHGEVRHAAAGGRCDPCAALTRGSRISHADEQKFKAVMAENEVLLQENRLLQAYLERSVAKAGGPAPAHPDDAQDEPQGAAADGAVPRAM